MKTNTNTNMFNYYTYDRLFNKGHVGVIVSPACEEAQDLLDSAFYEARKQGEFEGIEKGNLNVTFEIFKPFDENECRKVLLNVIYTNGSKSIEVLPEKTYMDLIQAVRMDVEDRCDTIASIIRLCSVYYSE